MKEIRFGTENKFAIIIDDDLYPMFSGFKLYLCSFKYVEVYEQGKHILVHHLVMGKPLNGNQIDHIDGNPLNNQRSNLRICTVSQNSMNTRKRSDNTSGYKHVGWDGQRNKWKVSIVVNKKRKHIGFFENIRTAVIAAKFARNFLHGEFANHG